MIPAKKLKRILCCLIAFLFVWIILAAGLAKYLVNERPLVKADAMVVLSGSAAYRERARTAAELYKNGVAPKILITNDGRAGGWDEELRRNPYFAERTFNLLEKQGVPGEAIEMLPTVVDGTHDEADLVARVSGERGFKSVLLVTSDYHTRRALATFEKALAQRNLSPTVGVKGAPSSEGPSPFTWWLTPQGWKTIGLEVVKLVFYSIRY